MCSASLYHAAVHVSPSLGKLVFLVLLCTIATLVGPIIGGISGVVLVLLGITLCVVVIGVIYCRRPNCKVHKHTRLTPVAVPYGEYNTILDWLKCYDH